MCGRLRRAGQPRRHPRADGGRHRLRAWATHSSTRSRWRRGRPVPANFDTYRSLRINEMPEVEVDVLQLDRKADRGRRAGRTADRPAVANACMARLGLGRSALRCPSSRGRLMKRLPQCRFGRGRPGRRCAPDHDRPAAPAARRHGIARLRASPASPTSGRVRSRSSRRPARSCCTRAA